MRARALKSAVPERWLLASLPLPPLLVVLPRRDTPVVVKGSVMLKLPPPPPPLLALGLVPPTGNKGEGESTMRCINRGGEDVDDEADWGVE